jgi:SAM-dependent methyltransferase
MKKILANMYKNARDLNDFYFEKSIKESGPFETFLDVGCWDGKLTKKYAEIVNAKNILGIEVVASMAKEANLLGIKTVAIEADRDTWPYADASIDGIVSNQVVEHLTNIDHFLSEVSRVLKPGGILITSTNNLSSWHNIGALIFGWSPFDLSNCSVKTLGLGNPLSVHKGESGHPPSWTHKCIYTPKWFIQWQEVYQLKNINLYGAGFYPLPAYFGNIFKNHSAFMILTARKK